jgi:hypothetical protein
VHSAVRTQNFIDKSLDQIQKSKNTCSLLKRLTGKNTKIMKNNKNKNMRSKKKRRNNMMKKKIKLKKKKRNNLKKNFKNLKMKCIHSN